MAWTPYQYFLAVMMVVTGSINTLATKWADKSESRGWDGGPPKEFNHPFLQSVGMFLGGKIPYHEFDTSSNLGFFQSSRVWRPLRSPTGGTRGRMSLKRTCRHPLPEVVIITQ